MSQRTTGIGSIAAALLAAGSLLAVGCGEGMADERGPVTATTAALASVCPPPLPSPTLAPPAGNRLAFSLSATGVQIYACQAPAGAAPSWVFQAPQATLVDKHGRVAATHFAGPTWQANDGSQVVAAKVAAFTPDPSAIPWLLLQAASHTGTGRMADVTFIQRLATVGGIAPPASTCDATQVGQISRVDYTAVYSFFKAGDGDDGGEAGGDGAEGCGHGD